VFAVLTLIWGTTWGAIRVGLEGLPPFTAISIRFAIATTILLVYAAATKVPLGKHPHEKTLWIVNGLLFFSVSYGVVYWSEQFIPSGLSAILFALFPLLVTLLAHYALPNEPLRRRGAIGVALGFLGIVVIFSEDFAKFGGRQALIAAAVMLLSPFVSALSSVGIKKYGAGIHPVSVAAMPMGIATLVTGVLALVFERHREIAFTPKSVAALLYLAICGSSVTFTLYYWLLRHVRAGRVALIAYMTPIVAVIFGVGFLHERLTPRIVLGALLVIFGVILAVRAHPEAEPTEPEGIDTIGIEP